MNSLFQNKYRIASARHPCWDYGQNAAYFVTICTKNKEHYFGNIDNDKIELSEIGCVAQQYWIDIPQHFPFVILDEFVVMPNHIHGILIFNKADDIAQATVETRHALSLPLRHNNVFVIKEKTPFHPLLALLNLLSQNTPVKISFYLNGKLVFMMLLFGIINNTKSFANIFTTTP